MRILAGVAVLLSAASPAPAQDQQVGARAKAMGGSYTAFEDDPVSVWLNPAGIATQPDGLAIAYQAYTIYDAHGEIEDSVPVYKAEMGWSDPAITPSYLGTTVQLGTVENPSALGFCFVAPFRLGFGYKEDGKRDPEEISNSVDQSFYRLRAAFAHDLRLAPAGAEGFLTHVALGAGLDVNVTSWTHSKAEHTDEDPDPNVFVPGQAFTLTTSGTEIGFGGGIGILVGVYDSAELKVNLGAAWQSASRYEFSIDDPTVPLFDWPSQYQVGCTFYVGEGLPLRITTDAQLIQWDGATRNSALPGVGDFKDVVNLSLGAEYRFKVSPSVTLYPRVGLRRYDAPWNSASALPAIGTAQLDIQTGGEQFAIFSAGLGVGWIREGGKLRTFDFAFDVGGDAPGFAVGYNMEF